MTQEQEKQLRELQRIKRREEAKERRQFNDAFRRECQRRWGMSPTQIDDMIKRPHAVSSSGQDIGYIGGYAE